MAVTNGWGQGVENNTIDWGKGSTNNTNNWGSIYGSSSAGETLLSGASFSNTYSIELNGGDQYMDAGSFTAFDSQDKFSVSMWVKMPSGGGGYVFAKNRADSHWGNRFNFFVDEGKIEVNTSNLAFRNTGLSLGNNWMSVIFVIDRTQGTILDRCKVYINGSVIVNAQNSNFAQITADSEPLLVGTRTIGTSSPSVNNPFEGYMDEVALFNIALSSAEASAIGSSTPTDLTGHAGLINWWRMGDNNGGTGSTITDQAGSNNGTLINTPTFSTDVPT